MNLKNKKAESNTGVILGIIGVIVFIILVVVGLIIASQKGLFNKEPEVQTSTLKLYLKAIDSKTRESIDAKYTLDYTANGKPIIFSQGELKKDIFTEIENVSTNNIIHAHVYGDNYYMIKALKQFMPQEIQMNVSKFIVELIKIGDISTTHSGNLNSDSTNIINLNLSSVGWFYKPKICVAWTPGIISVNKQNNFLICETGLWLNWSEYNLEKNEYTYYENNYFRCGEDWLERCEYVNNNQCRVYDSQVPYRYLGLVDACIYVGKSLNNNSINIPLEIRTGALNSFDEITLYIMDSDRRWNPTENMFTWMTEDFEGNNLGNKEDLVYKINI